MTLAEWYTLTREEMEQTPYPSRFEFAQGRHGDNWFPMQFEYWDELVAISPRPVSDAFARMDLTALEAAEAQGGDPFPSQRELAERWGWSRQQVRGLLRGQRRAGPAEDKSIVYFIQMGDGPIKIGRSVDPVGRLAALQTAHAYPLRIIATRPGGAREEARLHRLFEATHMLGEWFQPSSELLAEIVK